MTFRSPRCAWSDAIDRLFAHYDKSGSPGLNLAVLKSGEIIHQRGYGRASIEHDIAFAGNTILRIGSTTKHMCATALLCLENAGRLRLDDDVRTYLPEIPDYGAPISLRHLATMTSGMPDGLNLILFSGLDLHSGVSQARIFEMQQRLRTLMFAPGEGWSYSNTNYALLSLVIERVSGQSLADFMRDNLFAPLGMRDTSLSPWGVEALPHKAAGYVRDASGDYRLASMMTETSGDGGVQSTLDDMIAWYRNYRADALFGPDYRARLETEAILANGEPTGYGLGVAIGAYRGVRRIGHGGGMPGYMCDFVHFPDEDFGVVLLANVTDKTLKQSADRIADIVLFGEHESATPRDPRIVNPADAPRAAPGFYVGDQSGEIIELKAHDDQLFCYRLGEGWPLTRIDDETFAPTTREAVQAISFTRANACALRLIGRTPIAMTHTELRDCDLETAEKLPGCYYARDLGEFFHILRDAEGPYLQTANPLRPLYWRRFKQIAPDLLLCLVDGEPSATNVVVRIIRDGARISAMDFSISRVSDIRFERLETPPPLGDGQ